MTDETEQGCPRCGSTFPIRLVERRIHRYLVYAISPPNDERAGQVRYDTLDDDSDGVDGPTLQCGMCWQEWWPESDDEPYEEVGT